MNDRIIVTDDYGPAESIALWLPPVGTLATEWQELSDVGLTEHIDQAAADLRAGLDEKARRSAGT